MTRQTVKCRLDEFDLGFSVGGSGSESLHCSGFLVWSVLAVPVLVPVYTLLSSNFLFQALKLCSPSHNNINLISEVDRYFTNTLSRSGAGIGPSVVP